LADRFACTYEREEKEMWERYCASVGMAEYTPEDESAQRVLARADEAMYVNKMSFKQLYGSYR
jgi:PleD family two-component response regulator